jgi:hypothetical protein
MSETHEFGLRFRNETETEGFGSMMIKVSLPSVNLTGMMRRAVSDTMRQHPAVLFDGMIYYGSRENI